MTRGHRTWSVVLFVLASACQRDRRFQTVAVYEAPRSGCLIRVEASGVVRAGADLSQQSSARVAFGPKSDSSSRAGQDSSVPRAGALDVAFQDGYVRFGSESYMQGSAPRWTLDALSSLLSGAGCSPDAAEAEELLSAIEGVLFGPKGTKMSGQTRALKVVSTAFER
jgi:hypothetical protein